MATHPPTTDLKPCPFCDNQYKRLGNHLPHCPNRQNQSYTDYLAKKRHRSKKQSCPKCGKFFKRLDTHLARSASCKGAGAVDKSRQDSQPLLEEHSGSPDLARHPHPSPPHPPNPPTLIEPSCTNNNTPQLRPALKLPTSDNDWKNANVFFKFLLVPQVLNEKSVDDKCAKLADGLYDYFASSYGVTG